MRNTLLILAILLVLSVPAGAVNFIQNGDFETGNMNGWTPYTSDGSPSISVVTDSVHNGTYALRVNAYGGEGGFYQVIDTVASQEVKLTLWQKGRGGRISFDLDGGTDPNAQDWVWLPRSANLGYSWSAYTTSFVPTGSKTTIFFNVSNNDIYFDYLFTGDVGSIEGYVTDSVSSQPIEGVNIATTTGGYAAVTDADGHYAIGSVFNNTYTLQFRDYRYEDKDVSVTVTNGPANVSALLVPKSKGTISGKVTGKAGADVLGARVWVENSGIEGITAANGTYTILNVPAGAYTLKCEKAGYIPQSTPVTVNIGATSTINYPLVWRTVNAANALTNGDFEGSAMAPWTPWLATHFGNHSDLDPSCPGYGDQWVGIGDSTDITVKAGTGVSSTKGLRLGQSVIDGGDVVGWGAAGGVWQQCYVEPGKYYRVKAQFKGSFDQEIYWYDVQVGLVDGKYGPGMYLNYNDPPANTDDVFMFACGDENALTMSYAVPEPQRWWHNLMSQRNKNYIGSIGWDWDSTANYAAPRNYGASCIRQATGDVMTVILYAAVVKGDPEGPQYVTFDNVVLEEVPGPQPPVITKLSDLSKFDVSLPYPNYPDIIPDYSFALNMTSPKVVTYSYEDPYYTNRFCYIEESDRSAGIKLAVPLDDPVTPAVADTITFKGTLKIDFLGERVITLDPGTTQTVQSGADVPAALGMNIGLLSANVGGVIAMPDKMGLGNIGLLVRVWGKVVQTYNDGFANVMQVRDGDGKTVWVRGVPTLPDVDTMVAASGVLGLTQVSEYAPAELIIQMRDATAQDDFSSY